MEVLTSFWIGVFSSLTAAVLLVARNRARFRLKFQRMVRLVESLVDEIHRDNYRFDCIVAIGRNSGVVGSIMAGVVGLSAIVSLSTSKTRLPDGTRTVDLDDISRLTLSGLSAKRVLLLICCNDSGVSLAYVIDQLRGVSDPPLEVRTAAIYTAPSPVLMPQYRAVVIGKDSGQSMTEILEGLPWASKRWIHPFGSERSRSRR